MQPLHWDEVQEEVSRTVAKSPDPFASSVVANARDLICVCRDLCPLPTWVAKGYFSTFSLSWPKFEIEVFDDHLEIYHFAEDQSFDIWYEPHHPHDGFSQRLMSELSGLRKT